MTRSKSIVFIICGALITFLSGGYGTLLRSSTVVLKNELSMYVVMSPVTLYPFILLFKWTRKYKGANSFIAISGITIGLVGAYVYYTDMIISKDPSWGFSMIIAPIFQLICLGLVRGILGFNPSFKQNA